TAAFDVRMRDLRGVPRKQYSLTFRELAGSHFPSWSVDMLQGQDEIIAWDAFHRQKWILETEDWQIADNEPGRLFPGAAENRVSMLGHLAVVELRDRFVVLD